ncbi:MAG TPA: VOC family protein [Thermoplasmata archaeon]|nr:VOC family protein [Thermoplasmata archaeon]
MVGSYLSYFGIRVTDVERALRIYAGILGLQEISRGDRSADGGGTIVLLKDPFSGQKLELNWYPPGSRFAVPYTPGEGLDHLAFRVADIRATIARLAAAGGQLALPEYPVEPMPGFHVAYVKDPDGNWIELWQQPEPIPEQAPEAY